MALQFPAEVKLSQLTTFLKTIQTQGSKAEVSAVARELHTDLVMLLPILDASEMLQLATVEKGAVVLSKKGEELLSAGKSPSVVFKDSLREIEPFRSALSLRKFSGERIAQELAKKGIRWHHEDVMNAAIVKEILIHWGIASGLLDYDGYSTTFTVKS